MEKKFNELDPQTQISILNTILNGEENIKDLNNEETGFVFKEALSAMKKALLKVQSERDKKLCEIENKHNFTKRIEESHIGFNNGVSYRYDVEVKQCERCGFVDIKPIDKQEGRTK